jgi:FAD/FMN-containing dehydrogenase
VPKNGQSLVEGGIVIDRRTLSAVGNVSNDTIDVQPGASLERVLLTALNGGCALPVMTSCVMLSIGGFLSAGGQTRGSQRYGAFVDQVIELDVVTGEGRLVTRSESQERGLFDMVLAGMGQCCIIVRARLKVAPAPQQIAARTLTYTSVDKFLADQRQIASEARFDVIEGALARSGDRIGAIGLRSQTSEPLAPISIRRRGCVTYPRTRFPMSFASRIATMP